jgi:hypothetical protein
MVVSLYIFEFCTECGARYQHFQNIYFRLGSKNLHTELDVILKSKHMILKGRQILFYSLIGRHKSYTWDGGFGRLFFCSQVFLTHRLPLFLPLLVFCKMRSRSSHFSFTSLLKCLRELFVTFPRFFTSTHKALIDFNIFCLSSPFSRNITKSHLFYFYPHCLDV